MIIFRGSERGFENKLNIFRVAELVFASPRCSVVRRPISTRSWYVCSGFLDMFLCTWYEDGCPLSEPIPRCPVLPGPVPLPCRAPPRLDPPVACSGYGLDRCYVMSSYVKSSQVTSCRGMTSQVKSIQVKFHHLMSYIAVSFQFILCRALSLHVISRYVTPFNVKLINSSTYFFTQQEDSQKCSHDNI